MSASLAKPKVAARNGPVARRQARAGYMRRAGCSSWDSPVHRFAILARSVDQLAEAIANPSQEGTNA